MNKRYALLLILIFTASSLIAVKPTRSSVTKPSVPEFTVKLVDSSYDVPTTYSIDPYTGENVTHTGYHVESRSIDVTIKNQPFIPYYDVSSGWNIGFYYNIRIKGHYSEDWIELYRASDGYPTRSDSQYTIISYTLGENTDTILGTKMIEFPYGAQEDFQVEALIGYISRVNNPNATTQLEMYPYVFTGEISGWSETQTLTISAPDSITTPDTSPSQNSTAAMLTLLGVIVVLLVIVVVYLRRRSKVNRV